jgi:hypothetical protein
MIGLLGMFAASSYDVIPKDPRRTLLSKLCARLRDAIGIAANPISSSGYETRCAFHISLSRGNESRKVRHNKGYTDPDAGFREAGEMTAKDYLRKKTR